MLYDFACPNNHPDYEVRCSMADKNAQPHPCPKCGEPGHSVILVAPAMPTQIVVDYPGSKKSKAGYQHSHADRPGTKTQVGYGGKITATETPVQSEAVWTNPVG